MPRVFRVFAFCLPCLLFCTSHAVASDVQWRVALSSSDPGISEPSLPAAHSFSHAGLADSGTGMLGFQWAPTSTLTPDGNWVERGTSFAEYAAVGVTGAQGPGRSGSESTHVFRSLYYGDANDSGVRAFGATANDPADPASSASIGAWLWDGTKNVEIARVGASGALGPGLDSGRVYTSLHNTNDLNSNVNVLTLPNRQVLFAGRIGTAATLGSDGLSIYVPGSGNHPCMLQGSSDTTLYPGLVGTTFGGISALTAVSPGGDVYAYAFVNPNGTVFDDGIWQFCNGAPRPAVLTQVAGKFGPGLADANAIFGTDSTGLSAYIAPSLPGSFYFSSGGKMSAASGGASFFGLFHHDNAQQRNVPMLLQNTQGALGPQIAGYVFHMNVATYNVRAAGKYAALLTTISPAGTPSSSNNGLWRITADGTIAPVAITGNTGACAPAPGRIWNGTYYQYAVFDNGDIVVLADTKNVASSIVATSWWRLSRDAAPLEILKAGDLVIVPTPTGTITAPVTSVYAQVVLGVPPPAGRDTWFSANGNILAQVTIQGYASTTTLVRGLAARPNIIFANGFD